MIGDVFRLVGLFILLCILWAIGDEHWDDDGTDVFP